LSSVLVIGCKGISPVEMNITNVYSLPVGLLDRFAPTWLQCLTTNSFAAIRATSYGMAVQVVGSRLQVVEGRQRPQRVTNWRDALSGTEDYSDVMVFMERVPSSSGDCF